MGQWSVVDGHSQGHWSEVKGQRLLDSRSRVKDHRSKETGHGSRVSGQGSWSGVTGQRSPASGQGSLVRGEGSLVSQGSLVKGHWSVIKGHWSNHFLSSNLTRIRFSRMFGSNDILKTTNFQVRDLDLQAMGGGGNGTEKNFRPISIITPYMNPIHPRVGKY